jgi:hypothetical protein
MNEPDAKAQQQIVDKIKATTNILVTVSKNPSVDDLSAAIGLVAFLNKLDKHATAIFSGTIPPAITFLDPDKVFENTADSLRDFIIALDKEKADHLRYKIDGDVVKIFITPYRTTISEKDLEFTQGDYNIELVLALGVANQEHLDMALAANGQILHDVTIMTFSDGDQSSQLGSVDWRDQNSSCLSEMVASIIDVLKTEKVLMDKQIATALLTGIVSATDRFSNPRTTSRVMTLSAQLMAAGADQQLIAAKLQESHAVGPSSSISVDKITTPKDKDKTGSSTPIIPVSEKATTPPEILLVSHEPKVTEKDEPSPPEPATPTQIKDFNPPTSTLPPVEKVNEVISDVNSPKEGTAEEPLLGGILSSTTEQAAEDARRELENQQNKTILSHSYLEGSDASQTAPINSANQAEDTKIVDIFDDAPSSSNISTLAAPVDVPPPPPPPSTGLPLPPPLPDFSTLPPSEPSPIVSSDSESFLHTSTLPPTDPNDPSQFQIPM